jgi:hypothetical protein
VALKGEEERIARSCSCAAHSGKALVTAQFHTKYLLLLSVATWSVSWNLTGYTWHNLIRGSSHMRVFYVWRYSQ